MVAAGQRGELIQTCIDNCLKCYRVCAQASAHCLITAGERAQASHIRLLHDCCEMCRTSADFMLRESDLHALTCAACAEVCEQCARSCRWTLDDPQMARCADTCERCAASCREMSGGMTTTREWPP